MIYSIKRLNGETIEYEPVDFILESNMSIPRIVLFKIMNPKRKWDHMGNISFGNLKLFLDICIHKKDKNATIYFKK